MSAIVSTVMYIVGLFILYIIIEAAVRRGINRSIVGQFLERKKYYGDHRLDDDR